MLVIQRWFALILVLLSVGYYGFVYPNLIIGFGLGCLFIIAWSWSDE